MNTILKPEAAGSMFGVTGRFNNVIGEPGASTLASQTFTSETRPAPSYGAHATISAEVRFDDNCRNGHNSFAITATIRDSRFKGGRGYLAGGCCHDEIAKAFPELARLIPWHLTSTDGPMHYLANTVYHAGDRDHNGLRRRIGEGKARDLNAARNSAVWPDATDAELSVEPDELRIALAKRLPFLLAEFKADMLAAGFIWTE